MIKKVIIRDGENHIVSILYFEEGSKLSYSQNFTIDGTKLMQVDLYLEDSYKDSYIGSINCWEGTIEEKTMLINEDGILVEKEV